ncbi:MAG TPA: hypothetical protein VG860_03675 [Terriglobia bacterium]|nr:hypothetical protein [Terriglobia bacterium]
MSYLAALRSASGVVLSADQQETVGEDISYVEKIVNERAGHYNLAIGGAGMDQLVDGFILHIIEEASKPDVDDLRLLIQKRLREYYENDIRLYPGKHKMLAFLIAVNDTLNGKVYLWQTKGMRLFDVKNYAVIGYNAPFAKYMLRRMYRDDLPLSQLVLLATYVVAVAKTTATSVGLGTQIAIVRENGIALEPPDDIEEMEDRLRDYEKAMNQVFLACADTSIHVSKLQEMLQEFSDAALALHRSHIDKSVDRKGWEGLINRNDPYPKRPLNSVVTGTGDGRLVFEHDPEKRDRKLNRFRQIMQPLMLGKPRYLKCTNCPAELEYMLSAEPGTGPGKLNCPECGALLRSPAGQADRVRKIGTDEWKVVEGGANA